tara:strand:+ start:62 stop:658 length:597 start_codon:yes stop_codon:yes gene_type:complete
VSKGLSLVDFLYLNQKTDFASNELKSLIKAHGSLEYNIKKHIRLMDKVPKMDKSQGSPRWLNKRPFQLLVRKILDIESRIDQYISLMLESEIDLPETVFDYIRIQDFQDYYKGKSNVKDNPNDKLESQKNEIDKVNLTNDALWAIADDMRARKEEGEFETYMDAYRWAEKNISKKGVNITAKKLERAYHKAKSEGRIG